jgi:hypothetical protein
MSVCVIPAREGRSVWPGQSGSAGVDFKLHDGQPGGLFSLIKHPINEGASPHGSTENVRLQEAIAVA